METGREDIFLLIIFNYCLVNDIFRNDSIFPTLNSFVSTLLLLLLFSFFILHSARFQVILLYFFFSPADTACFFWGPIKIWDLIFFFFFYLEVWVTWTLWMHFKWDYPTMEKKDKLSCSRRKKKFFFFNFPGLPPFL